MVNVYLIFNGNCREAVEFYAEVFGTDMPQIMTMGDAPEDPDYPVSEENKKLIMHARLNISGSYVMFSDNVAGSAFTQGNNISLAVVHNNVDEIKNWFEKLKDGGKVEMELQETFWSKCYGSLTDKFGIHWQLSHESNN
ncbi:VOC family protein [Anaerocolumna sedimenticola]|nr:VOC family protein [Anaerocolumna sedimenticola]